MSAVLQLWSHTKTLKASSIIISFSSMTSELPDGAVAADRTTIILNVKHPAVCLRATSADRIFTDQTWMKPSCALS